MNCVVGIETLEWSRGIVFPLFYDTNLKIHRIDDIVFVPIQNSTWNHKESSHIATIGPDRITYMS